MSGGGVGWGERVEEALWAAASLNVVAVVGLVAGLYGLRRWTHDLALMV